MFFSKQNQSIFLAELISTFVLIFCGTGSIVFNQLSGGDSIGHIGVSITTGLTVTAMIYSLGSISGAHMNPIVTLALYLSKELPAKSIVLYVSAQAIGAFLASGLLHALFPEATTLGETLPSISDMKAFLLEVILSCILVLVVLSFTSKSNENKGFAGLVIGLVVLFEILFAGPICGASMNPIRSLAPALVSGKLTHQWVYLTAPFVGALVAVFSWKLLNRD